MDANLQLFLNRFIEVNQQKFADQPDVLALLDGLTLADVTFTRLEADPSLGTGGRVADLHSDSRKFDAKSQQWLCATLAGKDVITTIDDTLHPSVDDIKAQAVQGLYRMKVGSVESVVLALDHAAATEAEIGALVVSLLKADLQFAVEDAEITLPTPIVVGTDFTVEIDSDCIVDTVQVVWIPEPAAPAEEETPAAGEETPAEGSDTADAPKA